jgi:hypothetical protein
VGDHERRAALDERAQRGQQRIARRGVQAGGRLVEHEHRGVAQQRPRDGQAPALAAAQPAAARAQAGLPAAGKRADDLEHLRGAGGVLELVQGGVRPCLAQRVGHGDVGQQRLLAEHGDRLPHGRPA